MFSAYSAVLRFHEYQENYTPPLHAATREALEQAGQVAPDYAEAWGCLAGVYMNEYMFDFNPREGSGGPLERARALNPGHPSWYWFGFSLEAYCRRDYVKALTFANRLTMPEFFWEPLYVAMIQGQIGATAEAHEALDRCVALRPDLKANAREIVGRVIRQPDVVEHCIDGLRKAGLA